MKTLVHVDNEQIESVLKQCSICFVGMADTDGTPYVIPMNFGYKDGSLYLHSAQEGRSISILNRNPRVCISFCPTTELAIRMWKWLAVTGCGPAVLSVGEMLSLRKTTTRKWKHSIS